MRIRDNGTLEIFNGIDSKAARRTLPSEVHDKAAELLDRLNKAKALRKRVAGLIALGARPRAAPRKR